MNFGIPSPWRVDMIVNVRLGRNLPSLFQDSKLHTYWKSILLPSRDLPYSFSSPFAELRIKLHLNVLFLWVVYAPSTAVCWLTCYDTDCVLVFHFRKRLFIKDQIFILILPRFRRSQGNHILGKCYTGIDMLGERRNKTGGREKVLPPDKFKLICGRYRSQCNPCVESVELDIEKCISTSIVQILWHHGWHQLFQG